MTFWSTIFTGLKRPLILCLPLFPAFAVAQVTSISPYSRFGLGELHPGTQTEQFSMGGLAIPVNDPFAINAVNPASYHTLARPAFSVGMRHQLLNLRTENETQFNQNHTINNLAVSFPFAGRKWGLTFGVMPFSDIGYSITERATIPGSSEEVRFDYTGEGGVTRVYMGNSFRFYEKEDSLGNKSTFSAGLNMSYLFGSLDRVRKTVFPFDGFGYNVRVRDAFRLNDFIFDAGALYAFHLRKMTDKDKSFIRMNIGLTYRVPVNLNVRGSLLAETYTLGTLSNVENPVDTVNFIDYGKGAVGLPPAYGIGVAIDMVNRNFRKWFIGFEYRTEQWSSFSQSSADFRNLDELTDSHRFILGVDLMPNYRTSRKVLQKMHYRMGVRYEQTNLVLKNEQLDAYGISFGLGVPISLKRPQSPSTFNLGVELGRRGSTENTLVQEDFVMISFGLTLMPHFRNAWFVQRKYD